MVGDNGSEMQDISVRNSSSSPSMPNVSNASSPSMPNVDNASSPSMPNVSNASSPSMPSVSNASSPSMPSVSNGVNESLKRQGTSTTRNPSRSPPAQTFVFLDLETSGLYSSCNRITEFAMLAVSRTDLEAMKNVPPAKSRLPDNYRPVANAQIERKNCGSEVAKNRAKRKLFNDEFSEESIVGTFHPHSVDKRLKSLKLRSKSSEVCLDDVSTNNVDACISEPEDKSDAKDGQGSEQKVNPHVENGNNLTSCPEQKSNSHIGHDHPEPSCSKQTCDLAVQTVKHSTSHFHTLPKLPRVIEKLSKVFNPRTSIFPITEEISGLNNILVENSASIDSSFCDVFVKFLNLLPKPVCLVGHNAVQFDFPIMLSEFYSATNCQFKCPDVFCADSLTILKILDKVEVADEISMSKNDVAKNLDWFINDAVFQNLSLNEQSRGGCGTLKSNSEDTQFSNSHVKLEVTSNLPEVALYSLEDTPVKNSDTFSKPSISPETPVTPLHHTQHDAATPEQLIKIPACLPCTPISNQTPSTSFRPQSQCPPTPVKFPQLKKKNEPSLFFPPNSSFESKVLLASSDKEYNVGFKPSQKAFSQPVMYKRLFGEDYDAHRAEKDCEALLKIAGIYGEKFTSAADVLKKPLSTIKPAWFTNKMVNSEHFQQAWR